MRLAIPAVRLFTCVMLLSTAAAGSADVIDSFTAPQGPFTVGPGEVISEDEAVVTVFANTNRDGEVVTELLFEKRLGARGQVEIALPVIAKEEPAPSKRWLDNLTRL